VKKGEIYRLVVTYSTNEEKSILAIYKDLFLLGGKTFLKFELPPEKRGPGRKKKNPLPNVFYLNSDFLIYYEQIIPNE